MSGGVSRGGNCGQEDRNQRASSISITTSLRVSRLRFGRVEKAAIRVSASLSQLEAHGKAVQLILGGAGAAGPASPKGKTSQWLQYITAPISAAMRQARNRRRHARQKRDGQKQERGSGTIIILHPLLRIREADGATSLIAAAAFGINGTAE